MSRSFSVTTVASAAAAVLASTVGIQCARSQTDDRVGAARGRVEPELRRMCASIDIPYPPARLYLRAFKQQGQLEAWISASHDTAQPMKLLHTFPVLARSGKPGPKRREGDLQVPEGFYVIDRFNPKSNFHLSMGINYPNASDRILSDRERPGGDIFIHGGDLTIGCLPLGDPGIEMCYILARDVWAGRKKDASIPVHIFPARMEGEEWSAFLNNPAHTKNKTFWATLLPAFVHFEKTRQVPCVTVDGSGAYRLGAK